MSTLENFFWPLVNAKIKKNRFRINVGNVEQYLTHLKTHVFMHFPMIN